MREEDSRVQYFCKKRNGRQITCIFFAWREVTLSRRRHALHKEVEGLTVYKLRKRGILTALSAIAIGANSRKKLLQRRGDALEKARSTLTEKLAIRKQSHGIISTCMLQSELRRLFHNELYQWDQKRYVEGPFLVMKDAMIKRKERTLKAQHHFCWILRELTFYAWRDCALREGRRTPRYDQEKVDCFARSTALRICVKRWHAYSRIKAEAARKRRVVLTKLAHSYFMTWRTKARKCRSMKKEVIQNWQYHGDIVRISPFYKWRDWTISKRMREKDNVRFLNAHERKKNRRLLSKCFRHWGHYVVYGSVVGLYSRSGLVQKLNQQTRYISELEDAAETTHDTKLQLACIPQLQDELRKKADEIRILNVALKKVTEERDGARSLVKISPVEKESLRIASSRHIFCAQW